MPLVVVIVGPIASGKSTLSEAVGGKLRDKGRAVAVLDLDDAIEATGGWSGLTAVRFSKVQITFGKHIAAWLNQGVDVIAHGPIFEPGTLEAIHDNMPSEAQIHHVRLATTYEAALERVTADPNRPLSSDPDFLRMAYDRIGPLLDGLPSAQWTFDTTSTPIDYVVEELTKGLLH